MASQRVCAKSLELVVGRSTRMASAFMACGGEIRLRVLRRARELATGNQSTEWRDDLGELALQSSLGLGVAFVTPDNNLEHLGAHFRLTAQRRAHSATRAS